MQLLSQILLIAGTGRNTGKTTWACKIIEKFSVHQSVIGLKISPHFHRGTDSLKAVIENDNFRIYQETSYISSKDSSRLLSAGATKVYYIECLDEFIKEAFEAFQKIIDSTGPIVCESPALRKYIKPGIFIIVDNSSNRNKKKDVLESKSKADLFIETDKNSGEAFLDDLAYIDYSWQIKSRNFRL